MDTCKEMSKPADYQKHDGNSAIGKIRPSVKASNRQMGKIFEIKREDPKNHPSDAKVASGKDSQMTFGDRDLMDTCSFGKASSPPNLDMNK